MASRWAIQRRLIPQNRRLEYPVVLRLADTLKHLPGRQPHPVQPVPIPPARLLPPFLPGTVHNLHILPKHLQPKPQRPVILFKIKLPRIPGLRRFLYLPPNSHLHPQPYRQRLFHPLKLLLLHINHHIRRIPFSAPHKFVSIQFSSRPRPSPHPPAPGQRQPITLLLLPNLLHNPAHPHPFPLREPQCLFLHSILPIPIHPRKSTHQTQKQQEPRPWLPAASPFSTQP